MKGYFIIIFVTLFVTIIFFQFKLYQIGKKYERGMLVKLQMLEELDRKKAEAYLKYRYVAFFIAIAFLIVGFFINRN